MLNFALSLISMETKNAPIYLAQAPVLISLVFEMRNNSDFRKGLLLSIYVTVILITSYGSRQLVLN